MTGPYPTYPGSVVPVCERLVTIIQDFVPSIVIPGIMVKPENVFYGDQDRIPETPAICVEPSDKRRELQGAPHMTENFFEVFIMVYHNKVQSNELTRKECDQVAYAIEHHLHQDLQFTAGNPLDPMMIYACVLRSESGYSFKQNTQYRSARLTWTGRNKTGLPFA